MTRILDGAKKILVLGCSGSGKSTLTRLISEKYSLPAVHLDIHFWKEGWVETPRADWLPIVEKLSQEDRWVMDGTFSESFDLRFPRADIIILVNMPRLLCLYRVITRKLKYSKTNRRIDMAEGCDETFDLNFYKYIWTFNQKVLPKIDEAIKRHQCESKLISLRSPKEVEIFISKL
jgi:adenylate kinase family enzyme